MTISDHNVEFRQLFAEEATTRLARLSEQLLELEQSGSDPDLVSSIFREAHTIKGAAAVVGVEEASQVAHALEDLLEGVRSGERTVTSALVDAALTAVDGLTSMIPRLVAGEHCAEEASAIESQLRSWSASEATSPPAQNPDPSLVSRSPIQSTKAVDVKQEHSSRPNPRHKSIGNEPISVSMERLDDLVRLVGESAAAHLRVGRMLSERFGVDAAGVPEFRALSQVLNDLQERTMHARMVPVSTSTDQLHRAVRDLARSLGKQVRWEVRGDDTELDRGVLQRLADPLLHLVRNAVDHGIESPEERLAAGKDIEATLRLHAMQLGSEVIIAVTDDGRGIDVERVRVRAERQGIDTANLTDEEVLYLIFRSGLSTADAVSEVSGRGVGLDLVRANIEKVRGRVEIRTEPGAGSEFRIIVPITLAVLPCLLVGAGGRRFAIPMHSVAVVITRDPSKEAQSEGRPLVWVGDAAVPVSNLERVLGGCTDADADGPIVVLAGVTRRHAFRIDVLLGQRDVVVKGLGPLLPRLEVLAGASVDPDGSILLVLDAAALIERASNTMRGDHVRVSAAEDGPSASIERGSVLVVDDALTVRELQRSILERAGFDVEVAADGREALASLAVHQPDLVLTDVEMPHMDGFELTEAIRSNPALSNLPILMLTSRSSESDRQRGLDAGADGYIIKNAFDEARLLSAVNGLLGRTR